MVCARQQNDLVLVVWCLVSVGQQWRSTPLAQYVVSVDQQRKYFSAWLCNITLHFFCRVVGQHTYYCLGDRHWVGVLDPIICGTRDNLCW